MSNDKEAERAPAMTDETLTLDDFIRLVGDVHEHDPFPWQRDLVTHLLTHRAWPSIVDVPTGLGKTSVLDAAVFAAAAGIGPRRIFFVVDRRVVVDEAYEHAEHLADALTTQASGVVGDVARRLSMTMAKQANGRPISVTRMRGGATWEWRWLDRPDRVGIVVGTVDQIGSRLLFRAYGTSPRLTPIDAALVGTDSVIFVDEAHLAEPFLATLRAVQQLDHPANSVTAPAQVVQLSATTRTGSTQTDTLAFDLKENLSHDEAKRRLLAAKRLVLAECPEAQCVPVLTALASRAVDEKPGGLIAVMVNTVARARAVFNQLQQQLSGKAKLALFTGRSRPVDRQRLLKEWAPLITVGWRTGSAELLTRVIISTQALEVGANIDADVLITEAADWSALVQRIGRVNRVGRATDSLVVVLRPVSKKPDPVYGEARDHTWDWLIGLAPVVELKTPRDVTATEPDPLVPGRSLDVSPAALRGLRPPRPAVNPPPLAPVVFPQHLEGWARTAPIPIPDAPITPFLHGFAADRSTVRVVWRADLPEGCELTDVRDAWRVSVELIPPRSHEMVELPLAAVRSWLTDSPDPSIITDLDHDLETPPAEIGHRRDRLALRVSPDLEISPIDARQLRPDDLIVVPARYGGLDKYGWDPTSTEPVVDVAELGTTRRSPVIRLHPQTLPPLIRVTTEDEARAEKIGFLLRELLDRLVDEDPALPLNLPSRASDDSDITRVLVGLDTHLRAWWKTLHADGDRQTVFPRRLLVDRDPRGYVRVALAGGAARRAADTGAAGSSVSDVPLTLDKHHAEVGDLAEHMAANLGLPDDLVTAIGMAARWHDLGKLDVRFQTMLHRGDRSLAEASLRAGSPLAKSGIDPADLDTFQYAARASGYPSRGRHEVLSAVLARHMLSAHDRHDIDQELVIHLVGAHHGHGRPLYPAIPDSDPPASVTIPGRGEITLSTFGPVDWEGPARFDRLCRRYGYWGLALLESIVRLADIACSAGEHRYGDHT